MVTAFVPASAQTDPASTAPPNADLKFVMYFSRHGVRSPTDAQAQYDPYSAAAWPEWDVPPGYLTPHGYHLMELFGAYDRLEFARQGLFSATGCAEAARITILADSDQRTRETGKALANGMFPGCNVPIAALTEGTRNPLFHASVPNVAGAYSALAVAAIKGRIGDNPDNLTEAYRPQLAAFDHLLATCGKAASGSPKRMSLFDVPSGLSTGQGDHSAELRGPLTTAATLAENLLLEYAEGMDAAKVGWGCVDRSAVQSLMDLHTAASDFARRTPAVADAQASIILDNIYKAMEQAVEQRAIAGAPSKPADRALFLIGHDTNIANMAGVLNLTWIADGRRDDTPPGGALVFELWQHRGTGAYDVRVFFTAQTLEQMRFSKPLTLEKPPERVPVFIPGCSRSDLSCSWLSFSQTLHNAVVRGASPSLTSLGR
jgi:4-phytase/acid phosphatase